MGANEGLERFEGNAHYLLPGIPNDISLHEIAPKLSWKDFYGLSSVSPAWHHAIQSRLVYNARVLSPSTETLILNSYTYTNDILLYSMRDNSCYKLPPIPNLRSGAIPCGCQMIPLDGKIYVVGGKAFFDSGVYTDKVFVFDVAGQGKWKECASMNETKARFGCGVVHGKIFVFGIGFNRFSCGEVYDPMQNTWSLLTPMPSSLLEQRVVRFGEEVLLTSSWKGVGSTYIDWVKQLQWWRFGDSEDPRDCLQSSRSLEATGDERGIQFMAGGKIYSMGFHNIYVYNEEKKLWIHLHSYTVATIGSAAVFPHAVLAVDDELLALVSWYHRDRKIQGPLLLQSRGFGSNCKHIVWQIAQSSLPLLCSDWCSSVDHFMYLIKL